MFLPCALARTGRIWAALVARKWVRSMGKYANQFLRLNQSSCCNVCGTSGAGVTILSGRSYFEWSSYAADGRNDIRVPWDTAEFPVSKISRGGCAVPAAHKVARWIRSRVGCARAPKPWWTCRKASMWKTEMQPCQGLWKSHDQSLAGIKGLWGETVFWVWFLWSRAPKFQVPFSHERLEESKFWTTTIFFSHICIWVCWHKAGDLFRVEAEACSGKNMEIWSAVRSVWHCLTGLTLSAYIRNNLWTGNPDPRFRAESIRTFRYERAQH